MSSMRTNGVTVFENERKTETHSPQDDTFKVSLRFQLEGAIPAKLEQLRQVSMGLGRRDLASRRTLRKLAKRFLFDYHARRDCAIFVKSTPRLAYSFHMRGSHFKFVMLVDQKGLMFLKLSEDFCFGELLAFEHFLTSLRNNTTVHDLPISKPATPPLYQ